MKTTNKLLLFPAMLVAGVGIALIATAAEACEDGVYAKDGLMCWQRADPVDPTNCVETCIGNKPTDLGDEPMCYDQTSYVAIGAQNNFYQNPACMI